jgi:hypothetical protein
VYPTLRHFVVAALSVVEYDSDVLNTTLSVPFVGSRFESPSYAVWLMNNGEAPTIIFLAELYVSLAIFSLPPVFQKSNKNCQSWLGCLSSWYNNRPFGVKKQLI